MRSINKRKKELPLYQQKWESFPVPAGEERNSLFGMPDESSILIIHSVPENKIHVLRSIMELVALHQNPEKKALYLNVNPARIFYVPVAQYGSKFTKATTKHTTEYVKFVVEEQFPTIPLIITVGKEAYRWTYGEGYMHSIANLTGQPIYASRIIPSPPLIVMGDPDEFIHRVKRIDTHDVDAPLTPDLENTTNLSTDQMQEIGLKMGEFMAVGLHSLKNFNEDQEKKAGKS